LPAALWFDASVVGSEFIGIYETSQLAAAEYTIAVASIDQKTNIISDQITFTVKIRLRATGLNIVSGTAIADLTYLIGSTPVMLPVAEYFFWPANANTDSYHALAVSTPVFVTLVGDPSASPIIQIYTGDPADTSIYSISVTFTDLFSGLSETDTFVLTVSCVQAITQPTTVPRIMYWITDSNINLSFPLYTISPAGCPYEVYAETVTQTDGSALPNAIVFDGINAVDIYETDYMATGNYFVKVTVLDPKSKIKNFDLVFQVTVLCAKTIDVVLTNLPGSSSFEIDEKFLNSLTLTQPTFQPNPVECLIGTYTYALADSLGVVIPVPGFMTAFDNSSLTIATVNKSFEGLYNYKIKVTESISSLVNIDVTFSLELTVKIYALEMNLVTSTVIPDQNYLVADPAMVLLAYMYNFVPINAVLNV